jgi:glutathionylspermidine synthase
VRRLAVQPRADWEARVEQVGLVYHSGDAPYWNEAAHYAFTPREIDELERDTNELHARCLDAVTHVIRRRLYDRLQIPAAAVPLIEESWESDPPSLYGRFDLAYDGRSAPKMLEYNADTPTSLLEAAVVQWYWLQDVAPNRDQFNSIHERLIAAWRGAAGQLGADPVYFAAVDDVEDLMTVSYLRDTAQQAGLQTEHLPIDAIGWDEARGTFVDDADRPMRNVFKLYPWEWMVREQFAPNLLRARAATRWIEPAWKMVLSNKGILPILWELFPGHPNLLEAHFEDGFLEAYARKPLLSREGANVSLVLFDETLAESRGTYGEEGYVYQALATLPQFDGHRPVIGSWVVGGESAGIGIRETTSLITDNTSRFVPHLIE